MKQGRTITQKEADDYLAIGRLASRINDLEKEDYKFKHEMVSVNNRFGEECRVARYTLIEEGQLSLAV